MREAREMRNVSVIGGGCVGRGGGRSGSRGRGGDLREAFEESSLPLRADVFAWDSIPERLRSEIAPDHVAPVEGARARAGEAEG